MEEEQVRTLQSQFCYLTSVCVIMIKGPDKNEEFRTIPRDFGCSRTQKLINLH